MAGPEILLNAIFKALNLDPEKVKQEFTAKVKGFEDNFNLLVAHSQQVNSRLANIEKHLGIEVPQNGYGFGNHQIANQSAIAGNNQTEVVKNDLDNGASN